MQITFIMTIINLIILIAFISAVVYLFMLIVRALKKYINDAEVIGRSVKKVPYRQ